MIYVDAGTTYAKVISTSCHRALDGRYLIKMPHHRGHSDARHDMFYYIIPSKELLEHGIKPDRSCGHMAAGVNESGVTQGAAAMAENEIVALARGARKHVRPDATVLDLGSRDAKWLRFQDGKFHDMDWNSSCASSTGATIEMLLKFYDIEVNDLTPTQEKFPVTCGIFGLEKIMDDISNGARPAVAVSKFIHGIAYNAWSFAKKPEILYLSGGFCENECFVKSLENYCKVVPLGRFVLCEGLRDE